MAKNKPITIIKLNNAEVDRLLADEVYARFFPTRCNNCEKSREFNRRIFHITGVQKNKYSDEATQNFLQYHFLNQHKIEHIFFRTNSGKFYADSAICNKCKSTAIVFDIRIDDSMMKMFMPPEENKSIIKNLLSTLTN